MQSEDTDAWEANRFPTTSWNLVTAAKHREHECDAISQLITRYWRPVFYFIRSKGYPFHRAQDLTQDFFLRFLERDWIQPADPFRGRFRSFLLTILIRFLADQHGERVRKQASFEQKILSVSSLIGDVDRAFEPRSDQTPENTFMHRWAISLVDFVRDVVRSEFESEGRSPWYELFEASVMPQPGQRTSQEELAGRCGLSIDQLRYRVTQVKKRFEGAFQKELRREGCSEEEIAQELHELMAGLRG